MPVIDATPEPSLFQIVPVMSLPFRLMFHYMAEQPGACGISAFSIHAGRPCAQAADAVPRMSSPVSTESVFDICSLACSVTVQVGSHVVAYNFGDVTTCFARSCAVNSPIEAPDFGLGNVSRIQELVLRRTWVPALGKLPPCSSFLGRNAAGRERWNSVVGHALSVN
jgi:hypothetical protein